MIIFEWTKPGIWVEGLDREDAWRINGQIMRLEDALLEANVVLNMFEQARADDRTFENARSEFEARATISREVEAELFPDGMRPRDASGVDASTEYDRRRALVNFEVRHRLWSKGYLPSSLISKPPFVFAKAFIHALDLFGKFLGDIAQDRSAPSGINAIHDRFFEALPDLKGVRNSIQHAEDRSKGMARGKKIDLKEIDKSKISIEGTALVNSGLSGSKFGTTMADGHYGAVDITADTVGIMRSALLDVYSVFDWTGGKKLFP